MCCYTCIHMFRIFSSAHNNTLCRFSRNHVVLCGVWYGSDDPDMYTFLRPLVDFLNDHYTKGTCFITLKV